MRHPDRPTRLRCTRCDRPACPDCLRDASVGYHCVDCVNEGQRGVRRPRTFVGAELNTRPVVTPVLIALNVLIFGITAFQARSIASNALSPLFFDLRLRAFEVYDGEWWRLLTSGFLHYGPLHLALNMFALYVLGRDLEPAFGRRRFLALYVVSMLGGGVAVYLFDDVGTSVAGASGAVYGLMGALLVTLLKLKLNTNSLLMVIGLNVVMSFTLPNISWLGHFGGIAAGAALAAGLIYAPAQRRERWQSAAVVASVVILLGLVLIRTAQLTG